MLQNIAWLSILAIAIGAIPGAVSRYYLTEYCKRFLGTNFPYGTSIVNFTGCFLMGFCFTWFKEIDGFPPELDLLVRTGFLGSYTTFSTYGYETLTLWKNRQFAATLLYWLGSAILAVVGILLGQSLASTIAA